MSAITMSVSLNDYVLIKIFGFLSPIERVVIEWPSGRTEEYKDLQAGRSYDCIEGKGISSQNGY